jgi:hypothetical protein
VPDPHGADPEPALLFTAVITILAVEMLYKGVTGDSDGPGTARRRPSGDHQGEQLVGTSLRIKYCSRPASRRLVAWVSWIHHGAAGGLSASPEAAEVRDLGAIPRAVDGQPRSGPASATDRHPIARAKRQSLIAC